MALREIPREKIPWYPTVDADVCIGDRQCVEFCKNGVFEWDEDRNRPVVMNPFNCVVGCSACANICPVDAIRFPSLQEIRDVIRRLREEVTAK
jgi:NAD-dependent dihydropyrimidine dehydrogenase PreA subunit